MLSLVWQAAAVLGFGCLTTVCTDALRWRANLTRYAALACDLAEQPC